MNDIHSLITLLEKLEKLGVFYKLDKVRPDAIMVEVSVPGQRWEIEFNTYGDESRCEIEIEKFLSDGTIFDEKELEVLFRDFSD